MSKKVTLYCSKCNKYTDFDVCPVCGTTTQEDKQFAVYWCGECNTPVIRPRDNEPCKCPLCENPLHYLCADLRPVFPEERLLFELLEGEPLSHANDSVWAVGSKYYVNGTPSPITVNEIRSADSVRIREDLKRYLPELKYDKFEEYTARFIKANERHLNDITKEAFEFIEDASEGYPEEHVVASFSGGKDSTVVADLTVRALGNPYLVHIFGDTTLEFPSTIEYAERFRKSHPLAIFKTARNNDQDFYQVAEEIGPPARMMRWCCSMFKTGPITRSFASLFGNKRILTFQGVRKAESVTRSKYNRVEDSAESVKIQNQKAALPIFYWKDIDVWLYILSEGLDFNEAYRLGYERVGCWCCPNNNPRAEFLSRIYMPNESEKWHDFLVSFARRIGKLDAEVYVDSGKWKARQGGNGLKASDTVKVQANQCATEDNAFVFSLSRPYDDQIVTLMTPLGICADGLGRKLLNEKVFVDPKTKEPLFALMPFSNHETEHGAKIRILKEDETELIVRMTRYQVIKFNACRQCLKCESLCRFGAISVNEYEYYIDPNKCTHCRQCVTDKYLEGGCLMSKYLRTKE